MIYCSACAEAADERLATDSELCKQLIVRVETSRSSGWIGKPTVAIYPEVALPQQKNGTKLSQGTLDYALALEGRKQQSKLLLHFSFGRESRLSA